MAEIMDVSRYQGTINWEKVKASGKVDGVMIRAMGNSAAGRPLGKAALTDLTAYMLSTVESWGVYALLYTGLWFGSTFLYMGGAALKPYDVWLAAYRTKKPAPGWPFGMWQYTSKARVPGVTTNVDMSHAYKDYAGIISKKGLTRLREGK